ncbi:lysophospholipid acyltransferase family protein [Marinilabilia salmonicolor]|uniref:lysophospholipid acyltransferase family protein n=1 Tax=Marinilabilia salmonicolor TaxID=989 RepID=UPI00029A6456|nr:lysophospholipid acyltransferase family protein [Marinilabilia salmonicolor]
MNKLAYYIWHPLIWLISWLPFPALYAISDFLFYPVSIFGYRKKIILKNLAKAFPEKSIKWHKEVLKKFYRHFCDLFVETIKLQHISDKEIYKRITFGNTEIIDRATEEGKDVIAILGHYGNWEWVPAINMHIKAGSYSVYRPLKNRWFDRYMLDLRARFGSKNVTMKKTLRLVARLRKESNRFILGLIADQSPAKSEIQYWTNFLTQKTPILTGPEKIAKMVNGPVVYLKVSKPKRGHYHISIVPFEKEPVQTEENEITEWHVRQLEKSIIERPELWLWSHKRWKYQSEFSKMKSTYA